MPKLLLDDRSKMAAGKKNPRTGKQSSVLARLLAFDQKHRCPGRSCKPQCHLIRTDEVGRGCLAGPVVAAAVVLPELIAESPLAVSLAELNDSKKLNVQQREQLASVLREVCFWAIGEASPQEINNEYFASQSAGHASRCRAALCADGSHIHADAGFD